MVVSKGQVKSAAFAAALILTASTAHAVPVTFNFGGGNGQQSPTMIFSNGSGITLTVASNTFTTGTTGPNVTVTPEGKVGRWADGLGIIDGQRNDAHYVDGNGRDNVLSFAFSKAVRILSIGFSYNESGDDFAFFWDDDNNGSLKNDLVWRTKDIPGNSFYGTFSFLTLNPVQYVSKLFGVGAYGSDDDFKVRFVTVEAVRVSAVPVPAALPLFLTGLAGFAGLRSRRKRKA